MYGIDEGTVYYRLSKIGSLDQAVHCSPFKERIKAAIHYNSYLRHRITGASIGEKASVAFLVVGSHVHPVILDAKLRRNGDAGEPSDAYYVTLEDIDLHDDEDVSGYDVVNKLAKAYGSLLEYFEEYKLTLAGARGSRHKIDNHMVQISSIFGDHMTFNDLMKPFEDERWSAGLGVPLALVIPCVRWNTATRSRGEGMTVAYNPCLKSLKANSIITPFQTHQNIEMALNGFLAGQNDPEADISDGVMAASKGFDEKSFKTRKGSKKPRKRQP